MNKRIKVGRVRIFIRSGWESKEHPYWYFHKYQTGGLTLQSMWFNLHVSAKR